MIPLKLSITGSIGILSGMCIDHVELDLSELVPDEAVTIAIKGDNGSGKSTLLDLGMTPFLAPPQLAGSIYDHFGPVGSRMLEWSHGGTRYRSKIEYKQTDNTRGTRAYLHTWRDDQWHPVRISDNTQSDGKVRTYSLCLESILGPQSVFYLSAFRAQNAVGLADYDNPKALMRDLLHLDEPQLLAVKAAEIRLSLERSAYETKAMVDAITEKKNLVTDIDATITKLRTTLNDMRSIERKAMDRHGQTKAAYDHAYAERLNAESTTKARDKAQNRLKDCWLRWKEKRDDLKKRQIILEYRRASALRTSRVTRDSLNEDIREEMSALTIHRDLLDNEREIRRAVDVTAELHLQLGELESKQADIRSRIDEKRLAADRLLETSHSLDLSLQLFEKLDRSRLDLELRAGFVSAVPCHGEGAFSECPALLDAISASKAIPAQSVLLASAQQSVEELKEKKTVAEHELSEFGSPEQELLENGDQLGKILTKIASLQPLVEVAPKLAMAQEYADRSEKKLYILHDRRKVEENSLSDILAEIDKDVAGIKHQAVSAQAQEKTETCAIQAEIDSLPDVGDESEVDAAFRAMGDAMEDLDAAQESSARTVAAIAQQEAEGSALDREIKNGASVIDRHKKLSEEAALWRLLTVGLHGVIDLSIEAAGPGIAAIANKLLREAYGPRFTIRIASQQTLRNGRTVEIFDVSVIDAQTGLESSVTHKSGGESVWINKAITDAVGIYHQDAAGMNYETLFSDEAEDGLTSERKEQMYAMDRAALKLGGYKKKYFVSHDHAAWAYADCIIDIEELKKQ